MSPEVDISGWPNEAEVAAMLGISERTLRREAAKGRWQTRARQRPGKRSETVYNPDQVFARIPPAPSAIVKANGPATANMDIRPDMAELAGLPEISWLSITQFVESLLSEAQPQAAPQRFVNVKVAAAVTGLSASCIRRLMKEGKLPYLKDHNGWLTSRDALESFDPFAPAPKKRNRA